MMKPVNPAIRAISFKKNLEGLDKNPNLVKKPIPKTGTALIPYHP